MRKVFAFLSFLLILTGVCGHVGAQTDQYRFKHITVNEGLSHNQVLAFLKDRKGFVWIGTQSGLNRFDGNRVKVFTSDPTDSTSLADNYVSRLFEFPDGKIGVVGNTFSIYNPNTERFDRNVDAYFRRLKIPRLNILDIVPVGTNSYWFVHSRGLILFDDDKNTARMLLNRAGDTTSIASDTITSFSTDSRGNNWIIHRNGVLEKVAFQRDGGRVIYRNSVLQNKNRGSNYEYRMMTDADGDLWIYTLDDNQGLYFFDVRNNRFSHYTSSSSGIRLNTNIVSGVVQDNDGYIWVGTDHGGVNLIDKRRGVTRAIVHQDDEEKSIGQNSIDALYRDNQGMVWIGTYKRGVSYYHENTFRFPLYKHVARDPSSLPYGDVNRFVEDKNGNLWIGTNGGGLIHFDRKKQTYKQYRNDPGNPTSLSSDVIVSLCIDHDGKLWIGTYYGGLNMFDGKTFKRFNFDPADPASLSGRSVWEIYEDSENNLWIGTLDGGVNILDRSTGKFKRFATAGENSIQSTYISAIVEDSRGNMWFGTSSGIDVLVKATHKFKHFGAGVRPGELGNGSIHDIREASDGKMWIGTQGGLNIYDPDTERFTVYRENAGLPHSWVLTILEDQDKNMWIGSPGGLTRVLTVSDSINASQLRFLTFDESDGLPSRQLNENAAYKTPAGELVFGGPNGFTIFDPAETSLAAPIPSVVFVDFQLFDKSVRIGEVVDGRVILDSSITRLEKITLPPGQNFFSIECAALNSPFTGNTEFVYTLEGLHTGWLPLDKAIRKVTFTGINPGDYVLRVRAVSRDGVTPTPERRLAITLLPPFWKTKTALVLYVLLLGLILFFARKLIQQREKMKFVIEQERQEAMRMHELDMMKIRFFTNVSHEFRTPLTLILTPLEKLIKFAHDADHLNQYQLIHRNAKRLLNLVNQLLDFRKMEVQEIRFHPSEGDIVNFIRETVYSFSDLAEKKDITLAFSSTVGVLETIFDQDKLEKILFNLLSNAFKFTPEQGRVSVLVQLLRQDNSNILQIDVEDTGIGIPNDKLEKVFDRFFQHELPKTVLNQGSGIGLSITREFVRIHQGTIHVTSEVGKGSCFTVRLPIREVFHESVAAVDEEIQDPILQVEDNVGELDHLPMLLLVEDNDDFRFYLKDNLKIRFNILEARNGQEAWKIVLARQPDLVVSDIMMPLMNGMELCRKIKEDQRVSHIPVILLTARTSEEQKLEGFESGADEYITKPFNFEILESRIRGLIAQREKLHKTIGKPIDVKASELKITPLDTKFIENAIKCVEKNVASPEFSVEHLGKELGISRAYLYKKILALTGKSPLEFIRSIRMQHAAQLLEKSQLTVAEVAYQVGFNNPKYFSRYFKEEFNMLPSQYANKKR